MSDLATLNKSISLSSASHDFVLLAKSLGRCPWWNFQTQQLAQTVPSDEGARSPDGSESRRDADVAIVASALAPYEEMSDRVFCQPRRV